MNDYLTQYKRDLLLKGYSNKTRKIYTSIINNYLEYYKGNLKEETCEQIKDYLHYLLQIKKVSRPLMNQCYSALKFFYATTLRQNWEILKIPYIKHIKKLPEILGRAEISSLLDVTTNIKHKAILMVVYSAGLRVSEAAALKLVDIDSKANNIKVVEGKGKKDRYTLLAAKTLITLRAYYRIYRPKKWLFENQVSGQPLDTSTLQRVFKQATLKAKITKQVSIHSLRHSFATHLLEQGTDIHTVQRLLGHSHISTTIVYLHLKKENLTKVISPLDFSLSKNAED